MSRQPSSPEPSTTDQILDLLLDALLITPRQIDPRLNGSDAGMIRPVVLKQHLPFQQQRKQLIVG